MTLQAGTEFSERHTFFHWKVAAMGHRGVAHRADMSVRKKKAVALFPSRILWVVLQNMEVERGENIGHAEGTRKVTTPYRSEHFYDGYSYVFCLLFESGYLVVGEHTEII